MHKANLCKKKGTCIYNNLPVLSTLFYLPYCYVIFILIILIGLFFSDFVKLSPYCLKKSKHCILMVLITWQFKRHLQKGPNVACVQFVASLHLTHAFLVDHGTAPPSVSPLMKIHGVWNGLPKHLFVISGTKWLGYKMDFLLLDFTSSSNWIKNYWRVKSSW